MTTKPYAPFKGSFSFYYANRYQLNTSPLLDWNTSSEATHVLDHERYFLLNGYITYEADQNTSVMLNAGYIEGKAPYKVHSAQEIEPTLSDSLLGYSWGSAAYNELSQRKRFQARVRATHFVAPSSGFDMLLKAGAEYDFSHTARDLWKQNNLSIYYMNGSPYYYGTKTSPETGETVGTGKISLNFASYSQGLYVPKNEIRRISFFVSDTLTIANRITLNLGLRFDRSMSYQPEIGAAGISSGIGYKIGEELIAPLAGGHPFADVIIPEWRRMVGWNTLSPRVGLVLDLFGNSRTLLKGSFARYREYPSLQLLNSLNILDIDRAYNFYWYDDNGDTHVDLEDSFGLFPDDYELYTEDYYKQRLDPDLSAPYSDEITVSLQHELTTDLTLSVTGIQKEMKNIIENVLADRVSGQYWYTTGHDTEGWWIPFSTVVPGGQDIPDTPVTVYFPSKDAPLFFDRVINVPELVRKYRAVEFSLIKRMSHGWMFSGSVILSESTGNVGLGQIASSGSTSAAYNPNYFVNREASSKTDYDRPLIVKVMGAFQFPWGFTLSAYFRHMSGAPWSRSVTIAPPEEWAESNNAYPLYMPVLLEEPASNRLKATNILDLRLEKTFRLGNKSRLGFYVDVYNALGDTFDKILVNDGGYWFPSGENTTSGSRLISSKYNQTVALYGTKAFRLSIRLGF